MKKNLFFGLMALAGLFTSCSQDDAYAPPTADSNQVSMSIGMPADFVKTRATAPALANHKLRCILEVWTQDGATLKVRKEQPVTAGATNIVFNFTLADQGEYKAVLWADYIAENATETSGHYADKYYKTDDADGLKKVSIITSAYTYTDQVREAFTAVKTFTKGATAKNDLTARLVRPLTKVTIAEKNADMFAKCTSMTATYTVPSEFNAFDETVGAATCNATYNAAPVGGADITIKGQTCKILFSDYVFTATDGTMGGIELTFTGTETLKNKSIPANIPLKRNNWVRAAGNLITTDASGYDPNLTMTVDMTTGWVNQDIPDIDGARVGDYYYKDETWSSTYTNNSSNPCIGIVYEVNADGKSGKIVSLDEPPANWSGTNDAGRLSWGPMATQTNATSLTDGLQNMATIKNLSNDFSNYDAFRWVHARNPSDTDYSTATTGVWYLPARDELKALYDSYGATSYIGKDNFNNKLTNAGGTAITQIYYTSSTEKDNDKFHTCTLSFGTLTDAQKTTAFNIRCIRRF
ncbi:DUF6562 domain-containing protein [Parabacteroides chinchillae]